MMNAWRRRPFWMTKLGQGLRLSWESHAKPITGTAGVPVAAGAGELGVMFLGHSSFLIEQAGLQVLVDPVFATRLIVLRRQRRVGIRMKDLPAIDVVLLTHAHMDHLSRPTLRKIVRATRRKTGQAPMVVVPTGVTDLVSDLGFREVRTLGWWESTEVGGLTVTLTPAQHWGARIEGGGHRLYHSGDTAYFAGFREIGRRLKPEVALLPIGAYYPDSYRGVHTSPEDALRGFLELGAEVMVPMHFGTFRLGREPMDEPPVRLLAEARRLGVEERMRVLGEGETLVWRGRLEGKEVARGEDAAGAERMERKQVGVAGN